MIQLNRSHQRILLIAILAVGVGQLNGSAQDEKVPLQAQQRLAESQKLLAERFAKLEELFLRMSELESSTNPGRSGLLQQAAKLSKEQSMAQRMNSASELLTKKQFSRAIEEQQASTESLKKLLELLQSENRQDRVREERRKYEQWIKDIQRIERIERSLRGRTENGQQEQDAARDQADILAQADAIGKLLEESFGKEAQSDPKPVDPSSKPSPNSDPSDEQPKDEEDPAAPPSKDNENSPTKNEDQNTTPDGSKPKDAESKPTDGSKNGSDSPNQDALSQEPPQDDEGQPSTPSAEQNAQKRLDNAKKRMKRAEEKLKASQRQEAVQEQREAEKELKEAVAELEKVLRQLREEEVERSLVALEDRFKKMHTMQVGVLEETRRVNAFEGEVRIQQLEVQSSKISLEERKILMEGQRAMLLLQEEGSSTAFPEALQQMMEDVESVVERLQRSDVGELTIGIEEEIISALEEMLAALKEVQKKNEENKQQPAGPSPSGGGSAGGDQQQPLVDALAELRLIKTLQLRVNNRTEKLSHRLDDPKDSIGQATNDDLRAQIVELSSRQEKIQEVTREIVAQLRQKQ